MAKDHISLPVHYFSCENLPWNGHDYMMDILWAKFFFFFLNWVWGPHFWTDNMSHHILIKNAQRQLRRIEVQDLIHPKPEKFDLKQLSKQHTNITWTMFEPLFLFKHNLNKEKYG